MDDKKDTKPPRTLKLRKENLRTLTTDKLRQVQGGRMADDKCCAYGGTAMNSATVTD